MRTVQCYECGKRYDYDEDAFCPRCGAFNQPARASAKAALPPEGKGSDMAATARTQRRQKQLKKELGKNLQKMEEAVSKMLEDQNRGDRLRGGRR